jgi:hypothetical protein
MVGMLITCWVGFRIKTHALLVAVTVNANSTGWKNSIAQQCVTKLQIRYKNFFTDSSREIELELWITGMASTITSTAAFNSATNLAPGTTTPLTKRAFSPIITSD